MMRYELNGVAIAPPIGIDSLTLTKSRHRQYWGFFHRNMGVVSGLGSLRFTDPVAVRILAAGFAQVDAATTFSFQGEGIEYTAGINYETYQRGGEGVTVGLLDNSVADVIAARSATKYELVQSDGELLTGRSIGDPVELSVAKSTAVVQRSSGSGLPFSGTVEPSQPSVVWTNTSTAAVRVRIVGRIDASVISGGVSNYLFTANGTVLHMVSPSAGAITLLVNGWVNVPAGGQLVLTITTGSTATITYQPATKLTLTVEPSTDRSLAYGLSITHALRQLLDKMGLDNVPVSSSWLDKYGSGMLSTAAGLSGSKSATISLSLSDVLSNLTTLHYLKTGLTAGGALSIESRTGSGLPQPPFAYGQISNLTIRRAADFVYGSVTAGYDVPSDTAQRLAEKYRQRTYPTVATLSKNDLTLKPTWIVDTGRIEQARRGQLSANADKTSEVYYWKQPGWSLSAMAIRDRWADWWDYDTLPEFHTMQVNTAQPAYLNLGDEVGYEGPDNLTTYGELLDAQYSILDSMLTISLLVR